MEAAAFIKKENDDETAKICRWCLASCDDLEPLANDETGQCKLQNLFDCTGLQVSLLPVVPLYLCTLCESRLDKMYTFRWRCTKNIAVVDGFTEKQNTAKNEPKIAKDKFTASDAAHDLPLIQKSGNADQVNETHECGGNQADDLFEAEENPIAIKLENEDVEEQENSQTNPIDGMCQDGEDPFATTNTCINDSSSESIQSGNAAIGKKHKVGRKSKNEQEKKLPRLRSYKHRSYQQGNRSQQKHHCPHCSASYVHSSKLKIHIRTHTDEMPYACKICDRAFRSSKLLRNHCVRHYKDHKCPHCPSKFALSSELKVHIRTHTLKNPFVCEICDKRFSLFQNLLRHEKIHNTDEHHRCPHCPSKFPRLCHLNDHIRIHTGEKPFVCEICDEAFYSSAKLAQHSKSHNKKQHHRCPHCSSKFVHLSALTDHIRIHTGEKPYVCKICDETFSLSSNLARHKRIHINGKYHNCPHCPAKFTLLPTFKNHVRLHSGEQPFVCKICKKGFHSSSSLSSHTKTHKEVEYQQCPNCPSKFALLSKLENHMRIHSGEKSYVCEVCDKTFSSSGNLARHKKIHNKSK